MQGKRNVVRALRIRYQAAPFLFIYIELPYVVVVGTLAGGRVPACRLPSVPPEYVPGSQMPVLSTSCIRNRGCAGNNEAWLGSWPLPEHLATSIEVLKGRQPWSRASLCNSSSLGMPALA